MGKENSVLTIDIGGDSLKMAEFSFPSGGGIMLEKFAIAEYGADLADLKESGFVDVFSAVYNRLLADNNFVSRRVRISISGQSAFTRLSKLPPLGEDKSRIEQIVEYEAKQTVPYPMDEVIWDYQLVKHTVPSEKTPPPESGPAPEGESAPPENPAGIDEMEALFVAVKSDLVSELADAIQESGKEILSIEIAPIAFFNAARANQIGASQCDMILNIGGRCSSLVFADQGRVFARNIPIAGHSITQQISKEFNINFADAEELKRRHGFVALGGAYEEPDSEVAATISKIARNVMTRLHGEINRSINVWRSQYGGNRPVHLYLSGGSSLMVYTPRFFNEKLRIPVDYLNSFQIIGIAQGVNKEQLLEVAPMFSELIGMALKHIVTCPVDISLMPHSIKKFKALQHKKPYFYASAVSIVLCLLVFYWGVTKRLEFDSGRVDVAKKEVEKTNALVEKVKALKRDLDSAKGEYAEAIDIIDKRRQWPAFMNELQKMLPDTVWLSLFEGVGTMTTSAPSADPFARAVQPGGRRRGGPVAPVAPVAPAQQFTSTRGGTEINWIKFYGHSISFKQNSLWDEAFRINLKKSGLFADGDDSIVFESEGYIPEKGKNNITSFKLRGKLKEPIRK